MTLDPARFIKTTSCIPKPNTDFDKICKVIIGTLYFVMPWVVIYGDIKTWTIKKNKNSVEKVNLDVKNLNFKWK